MTSSPGLSGTVWAHTACYGVLKVVS